MLLTRCGQGLDEEERECVGSACEDFRLRYLFLWMSTTYWSLLAGVAFGVQCDSWGPPGVSSGSIVPSPSTLPRRGFARSPLRSRTSGPSVLVNDGGLCSGGGAWCVVCSSGCLSSPWLGPTPLAELCSPWLWTQLTNRGIHSFPPYVSATVGALPFA